MARERQALAPLLDSYFENGLSGTKPQGELQPELKEAIASAREKLYLLLGERVLENLLVNRERWTLIIEMVRASITKTDDGYNVGLFKLATIAGYLNSLEALARADRNVYHPPGRLG